MFENINEIAVVGCTFLILCLHTIWFSSILFGGLWEKHAPALTLKSAQSPAFQIVLIACSYAVTLAILANLLALSPLLSLSPFQLLLYVFVFAAALFSALCAHEKRTLIYFLIHTSFFFVLIVCGGFIIQYWPW